MPAGSRPWKHRRVELHGIKLEGNNVRECKIYGNFMRITQHLPVDSQGEGDPRDKIDNGVYIKSCATELTGNKLTDTSQRWEPHRWRFYWVKYAPHLPAVQIKDNDAVSLTAEFKSAKPGPYAIYMKWDYVPATPLNIACYDPEAMNEIYDNTIVALTKYKKTRHGGYGDSGQWASAIFFVGMDKGPASEGKYSAYIHDNSFFSNDLFISTNSRVNMTIRIENNTFTLAPDPTAGHTPFRNIGTELRASVMKGGNVFK